MPGPNDPIVKLLVERYGMPLDEADAYAYKIYEGQAGTAGNAVRDDAMNAHIGQWQRDHAALTANVAAAANPSLLARNPDMEEPQRQFLQRGRDIIAGEGQIAKKEQDAKLTEATSNELSRLANMFDWSASIKPMPRGGFTSPYAPPGDFSKLQPGGTAVIPVGPVVKAEKLPETDEELATRNVSVGLNRLLRAEQFRKSLLGR